MQCSLRRVWLLQVRCHHQSHGSQVGHLPAKAKHVIWVFINGGPSQVDTWNYRPELDKWNGKTIREFDSAFENTTGFFKNSVGNLMQSPFKFSPKGESGKMVPEIFPYLGEHVDKMAFLLSWPYRE